MGGFAAQEGGIVFKFVSEEAAAHGGYCRMEIKGRYGGMRSDSKAKQTEMG
jgi:hypothetical protein